MKTKTLLFGAALIATSLFSANAQKLIVNEDFSSKIWEDEFTRLNPGADEFGILINPNATKAVKYTTPPNTGGAAAYGPLNSTDLYLTKYKLGGWVEVLPTGLCSAGLVHTNPTTTDAVAFRPNNGTGFFEFPEFANAGTITVHVKNGNSTNDTNLGLEKYNATDDTWELINLFVLRKRNDLKNEAGDALLDEALSFEINSKTPIKLRLFNKKYDGGLASRFLNIYHIAVTDYTGNAVLNTGANVFKQMGRKLIVEQPTKLSIYNQVGSLVFEQQVQSHIVIPESIGSGIFMAQTAQGVQKIFLNK